MKYASCQVILFMIIGMRLQVPVLITKDDPMLWIAGKKRPIEYRTKSIIVKAIHLFNNIKGESVYINKEVGVCVCGWVCLASIIKMS